MTEQPTTAMSALRMMATTQAQVDVFSDQLIQSVREGEVNPLEVLVQLKAIEKVSERVIKEIRHNFLTEADKYQGTTFEFNGNKIEKAEVGTKYDFTVCKDQEWEQFAAQEQMWATRRKEREVFLKAVKGSLDIVTGDGEAVTIHPPTKTSTTSLKVSIR